MTIDRSVSFVTLTTQSDYRECKPGSASVYYVYVAVYGRANDLNMVGEHTIKPCGGGLGNLTQQDAISECQYRAIETSCGGA